MALSDSEDDSEDEDISMADRFKALQEATFRQKIDGVQDDSSDDEDDESEQGEVTYSTSSTLFHVNVNDNSFVVHLF